MQPLLNLLLKRHRKLPWAIQLALAKFVTTGAKFRFSRLFSDVETYATFIGYSRSGHSVVAALLDAHPNVVMAHELRALKYIQHGLSRESLYYLLFQNTRIRGHSWERRGGYKYDVPGQWQGSPTKIRVIGDKHAPVTASQLASRPELLATLKSAVNVPVKMIHVVRNPFDNITTVALRRTGHDEPPELSLIIEHYFQQCESVLAVKKIVGPDGVFDLWHEEFLRQPQATLKRLCLWLGVEPFSDYLDACSSILFDTPHNTRFTIEWKDDVRRMVEAQMHRFSFLKEYRFEA